MGQTKIAQVAPFIAVGIGGPRATPQDFAMNRDVQSPFSVSVDLGKMKKCRASKSVMLPTALATRYSHATTIPTS